MNSFSKSMPRGGLKFSAPNMTTLSPKQTAAMQLKDGPCEQGVHSVDSTSSLTESISLNSRTEDGSPKLRL